MSTRSAFLALALFLVIFALASCSPAPTPSVDPVTPQIAPIGESMSEAGHYVLAFVQVFVDPDEGAYEITPLRQVAGHWNVLKWLEQTPCTDCVEILEVKPLSNGAKEWTVQISHPFANPNLTGFDVRGIAMFSGSHSFPVSGLTTPDMNEGDGELLNADGYTTLYNSTTAGSGPGGLQGYIKGTYGSPLIPDATLNGYKRHVSFGGEDRQAMFAGESVSAKYEIKMPTTGFYFNYCVDASWAPPAVKPVTDPMTDFPPEANCPEPWNIRVEDKPIGGGMNAMGGQTKLEIRVYDWQGKSSYSLPVIECPELFDGTVTSAFDFDGSTYTKYTATIGNTKKADAGEYRVLISVEDDENATSPDWIDLTAYQIYLVTVDEFINDPPTAGALTVVTQTRPWFDVEFIDQSTDPQGVTDIVAYEWDFSYVESEGFQIDVDDKNPVWQFPETGLIQIQHRVRDASGATDMLDFPLQVSVEKLGDGFTIGGTNTDGCSDMFVTGTGDMYILGDTEGTIDLDPGPGTSNYSAKGGSDFYLTKLNSSGSLLWGYGWGDTGDDVAYSVMETNGGKVLIAGSFTGTVDFNPGSGSEKRTSNGTKCDAFILALNTSGTFDSVVTFGGTSWEGTTGVATDMSGGIYATGYFYGMVDFDPGTGVNEITSHGGSDVFILKLGLGGSVQWVATFGGSGNDWPWDISVDPMGMCVVGGNVMETVDFDSGDGVAEYTSKGDWDAFICKYDPTGAYVWSNAWGGTSKDQVSGVALTPMGAVLVTGSFIGNVDFDPGPSSDYHNAIGNYSDAFLGGYDAMGTFQWAKTWGAPNAQDFSSYVITKTSGALAADIFVTGQFYDTVDFDPTDHVEEHTSAGESDSFVLKYNLSGSFVWARTFGGTGFDEGVAVGADDNGYIYAAGKYFGSTDLDPSIGVTPYPSLGIFDVYINKLYSDGYW